MNIGIVGTGAMVRRFLSAVAGQIDGSTFSAAFSPNASRREQFAQEYPQIRCCEAYSEMLDDPGIDAVYIATPVFTHASLAVAAAQHGKHILCEKPMALTIQECQEMVAAAQENDVLLQIAYMMRYHPAHQYIYEQITSGSLGKIRYIHLERTAFADFKSPDFPPHRKWFVDRSRSGGGVFMDLGSHLLDLLIYFMGDDVQDCSLSAPIDSQLGVELSSLASLQYHNGALATIYTSWEVPLHDNIIQVYGEKASLQAVRTIGPYTDGRITRIQNGKRQDVEIPHQDHYLREVQHFLHCIQNHQEPLTSGSSSLKSERLRLELYQSLG